MIISHAAPSAPMGMSYGDGESKLFGPRQLALIVFVVTTTLRHGSVTLPAPWYL